MLQSIGPTWFCSAVILSNRGPPCASVKINLGITFSVKYYTRCVIAKQVLLEHGTELDSCARSRGFLLPTRDRRRAKIAKPSFIVLSLGGILQSYHETHAHTVFSSNLLVLWLFNEFVRCHVVIRHLLQIHTNFPTPI